MTTQAVMQKLFNDMVTALHKQGGKSMNGTGTQQHCRYRSDDGKKCAVGAVIPDALYSPELENQIVKREFMENSVIMIGALSSIGVDDDAGADFVRRMQIVHDKANVWDWPKLFRRVATDLGLSSAVVFELYGTEALK